MQQANWQPDFSTESVLLTIVIPTYQRPELLAKAVQSALAQKLEGFPAAAIEVLVVDDCSPKPVVLPVQPRLRLLRLSCNQGGAAARNEGARAAKGRYVTYLDDDDRLLPNMAQDAIAALQTAAEVHPSLPEPIAILGGIEVVDADGQVKSTRLPPTLPKGSHFVLEEAQPGKSFLCKQTMVLEKAVLLDIGGFDPSFPSRVHTELFLRLNQSCSILGLSRVTYQLTTHEGPRVSHNAALRQTSFELLVAKHRKLFDSHPKAFARFVYNHAQVLRRMGQKRLALKVLLLAFQTHFQESLALSAYDLKDGLKALWAERAQRSVTPIKVPVKTPSKTTT